MKTLVLVLLTIFTGLSRLEAQNNFVLHFLNESGGTCSAQMDLQPQGAKRNIRIWMFSNGSKEDSVSLRRGVSYPVEITTWSAEGRTSKTHLYTLSGDAKEDTLSLLAEASVAATYGETKEVIYDEEEVVPEEEASESDYLPAEDPVLEATPPDSLVPTVLTSARPPEKAKKKPPKAMFDKNPWELASWDSFSTAKQDSILLAEGKVELKVRNLTSDIFKFRVGHLWWEEQNGLLQDQSGIMIVDTDEHHELRRYIWSNGVLSGSMREDIYSFFVPRGVARHTITFGGPQIGRVVNQTDVAIRVSTPMMTQPVIILAQSSRDSVQCMTGKHLFTVYFGPNFDRFHRIPFELNDQLADNQVQAEEIVGGKRVVKVVRVDFVAIINPSHFRTALRVAR